MMQQRYGTWFGWWSAPHAVFIPPHHHPDAAGWSNVSNSGRCCMHAAGPAPIQRLTRAPDNGLPPPRRQVQIERGGWCGTALALPACARPRRVGRWLPACGLPVALARVRQAHFVRRSDLRPHAHALRGRGGNGMMGGIYFAPAARTHAPAFFLCSLPPRPCFPDAMDTCHDSFWLSAFTLPGA